jgi:hypothetical protein
MASVSRAQSGQAAVETAITMPLTIFMLLGTLQLFMLLQGRLFAEHAAYKAVRTGVVRHGDCKAMTHAAIAAVLPSFISYLGDGTEGGSADEKLANAWKARTIGHSDDNGYDPGLDNGHNGPVVWIFREHPRVAEVTPDSEDDFDDLDEPGYRLEVRLVYWYPLRIPFANWVMAAMYRAYFGLSAYNSVNPLMPTQKAKWTQAGMRTLGTSAAEFESRFSQGQYVFPVSASYGMRMMTPPRREFFKRQDCEPAP